MKTYAIGITGPSGSGKTELARRIQDQLVGATLLSLDSYYLSQAHLKVEEREKLNFDDPSMLDWDLVVEQITHLVRGEAIDHPIYSFENHTRVPETVRVEPARWLIIEGIFALHHPALRALYNAKFYVHAPDDVCLERRIERDVVERGRTRESVVWQYNTTVRPSADLYIKPTEQYADVSVSGVQPIDHSVADTLAFIGAVSAATPTDTAIE